MTRMLRNWTLEKVEDTPVAPHRYLYNGMDDRYQWDDDMPYKEAKAMIPYRPGEVVWVADGKSAKRARIIATMFERARDGDRREVYRIQYETAAGYWSKLFSYTYPGPIQRGYQNVGLAPDIPEETKKPRRVVPLKTTIDSPEDLS